MDMKTIDKKPTKGERLHPKAKKQWVTVGINIVLLGIKKKKKKKIIETFE